MKIILVLTISFLFSVSILSNSESAEKAENYCHCLKNAEKVSTKKKECIKLRAKQTKELGEKSPAYTSYLSLIKDCEMNK